jgi:hypothetical protein
VVYLDNGAWRANNLDKQFNIQQLWNSIRLLR